MKTKKVLFKDPNIPDREFMHLMLYEIAKLRVEVRALTEMALLSSAKDVAKQDEQLHEFAHEKVFSEIEFDMKQYIRNYKQGRK